jgi:hypothetical protein
MAEEDALHQVTLKMILEHSTCPMGHMGTDLRGVVYALAGPILTPYEGKTKVGFAQSLIHRIPQIVADIGGDVYPCGVVWTNDPPYLEARFHDLWSIYRTSVPYGREWFILSDGWVNWFKSLGTINSCLVKGYVAEPEALIEWLERSADGTW